MAEEITQRLGFNAEGAIAQLRKLQEQLDDQAKKFLSNPLAFKIDKNKQEIN